MIIPASTYRIQFNQTFGFKDASEIVDYLSRLGISHLYASPIFKARKGSMHGYDVVEPTKLNSELGGEADFDELIEKIKQNKMGWLQDIVPNHMAFHADNLILVDVLENGPYSRYAEFFDIEWGISAPKNQYRLLAPFLGKFYQQTLESGELVLRFDSDGFSINYYDNKFPLSIESYGSILSLNVEKLKQRYGYKNPDLLKYLGILYVVKSLNSFSELDERYDQIKFIKAILNELLKDNLEIKSFVNDNIKTFNGIPGQPESFNLMDELLSQQYFRLAYWKVANEEVNYRRFFNVNDLISLRLEDDDTFNRTHSLIIKYCKENVFDGLRIDHIDGLYNPADYLARLNERAKNTYTVVEKILEHGEQLPNWNTEGTTGYDFMNYLNLLFVDPEKERRFADIYRTFSSITKSFDDIKFEHKKFMVKSRMAGEVERLASLIVDISAHDRSGVDFTINGLKVALETFLIYFPVYRSYISPRQISKQDLKFINASYERSVREIPSLENEFNYLADVLRLKFPPHFNQEQKESAYKFIMKFQQLTGPLMAKGFEDTTLYFYNKFVSLNEVGGSPEVMGISISEFHKFLKNRSKNWPNSFNATSTHDTKRSEDLRARLNVISEIPDEWENAAALWHNINDGFKKNVNGRKWPDKNFEYLIYQILAGSFPLDGTASDSYKSRIKEYLIKAAREGKTFSSWTNPNPDYENSITEFIDKILGESGEFINSLKTFADDITIYGFYNSISQVIIKTLVPGVPDFYQGNELWDFSLVDPDNRRPVDFKLRSKYLSEISEKISDPSTLSKQLLGNMNDGKIKLFVTKLCLEIRNKHLSLLRNGKYTPLKSAGVHAKRIVSFAVYNEEGFIIAAVPRFLRQIKKHPMDDFWEDTSLELPFTVGSARNIFTSETVSPNEKIFIKDMLKQFPAAVLINAE